MFNPRKGHHLFSFTPPAAPPPLSYSINPFHRHAPLAQQFRHAPLADQMQHADSRDAVVFTRHQLGHAVGQRRIASVQQYLLHEAAGEAVVALRLGRQRVERLDVGVAPGLGDLARLPGLLLVLCLLYTSDAADE